MSDELKHRLTQKDYGDVPLGALDAMSDAADRIDALEAENKALREALESFADRADHLEPDWLDHECHWHPAVGSPVTIADLRRARALLAKDKANG